MNGGFFITLEGGEGAGKSTQIARLATALSAEGRKVLQTREPGGAPGAERIRSVILDPSAELDGLSLAMLFAAARHDHLRATIRPALASGAVVLCDRFLDSTRAYQGAAGDVAEADLLALEAVSVGATRPNLTLILDLPPEEGLARALARRGSFTAEGPDRFEARKLGFHRAVREGFLAIARAEPERCVLIDAMQAADDVFAACKAAIDTRLSP